jgi:hypothetical protein
MATATMTTILDRVIAIVDLMADVHTTRYWPRSLDTAKLPLLTAYPQTGARSSASAQEHRIRRTVLLAAFVGEFNRGIPTESTLRAAETLFAAVEDAFYPRSRLQLPGDPNGTILDGMVSAALGDDSGIYDDGGLARINFPLYVTYDSVVELL